MAAAGVGGETSSHVMNLHLLYPGRLCVYNTLCASCVKYYLIDLNDLYVNMMDNQENIMAIDTFRLKLPIHELVKEILDQLPDSVWQDPQIRFLDPAFGGGQFVLEIRRRLLEAGHSQDNIADRIWGCESLLTRVKYVQNWFKSGLHNLYVRDPISYDWGDMKFDVIVGNPPYQLTNSKKIWPDFVNLSLDLVRENGYVGLVIPSTWLTSDGAAYKKVRTRLTTTHNLIQVSRDADDHFEVGQDICYLISHAVPYVGQTVYVNDGSNTLVDLRLGIPKNAEEQSVDNIIQKMLNHEPKIWWVLNEREDCIKSADLKPHATKTHKYKVYQSTANVGYVNKEPMDYGKLKLAVNFSSSFYNDRASDYNMPITTDGVGSLMGYVLIKNKSQGERLRSYLCSKSVRFLVNHYKKAHTGFNTAVKRRQIPQVTDQMWTEQALYQLFGFTQAEIELIESSVR